MRDLEKKNQIKYKSNIIYTFELVIPRDEALPLK